MSATDPGTAAAAGARRAFNAELARAFAAASSGQPVHDEHLALAGQRLRLRFAGTALVEPVMRALRHLRAPPTDAPVQTVHLWDGLSTGVALPPCPWRLPGFFVRCDAVQHTWGERVHVAFSIRSGLLQYFDEEAGVAVAWVRDPARLEAWTRAAPLRGFWAAWAESLGGSAVHGAAVGVGGRGVLLSAPSGGGKSTTALACLARGFDIAGDDLVLLRQEPDGVAAHAVYGSAKVAPTQLLAGSGLGILRPPGGDDLMSENKLVMWLHETHPTRLASRLPLRAIVVPGVSARGETHLRPLPAAEALRAMAPATVFMVPGVGQRSYAALVAIARELPAFALELGRDHARNVAVLRALIDEAPGR